MSSTAYQYRVTYIAERRQFLIPLDEQSSFPTEFPRFCAIDGQVIAVPLGEGLLEFCRSNFMGMIGYHTQYVDDGIYLMAPTSAPHDHTFYLSLFPKQQRQNLRAFQDELAELLRFCFDVDYEPDTLASLSAADRYAQYCRTHHRDPELRQTSFVAPYPSSSESSAVKYTMRRTYLCSDLRDLAVLELALMLEENVQLRKCRRCGHYFLLKGNYDSQYCTRTYGTSTQTCQQLAATATFQSKLRDNDSNNAWGIYSRYYKRYYARIKRGALTKEQFQQWQEDAAAMRDQCVADAISLFEFETWLRNYFLGS